MMGKLILSIAVLMLAVSTTVALPTATNFGVNDASGNQNTFVQVPVSITNIQNGPIAGIIFKINFNSSIINLTKARVTLGDLTNEWDAPSYNPTTGIISINYGGSGTEIPNGESGSVIILNFSVIGTPGSISNMNITGIQLSDLNGIIGLTAPSKNGTFTVTSPPPPATGAITGNVAYSNNGTGIQSATVNLTNASGVIATTTTDSSGNYSFTNVIPGGYNVTASKPLFISNSTSVTVTAGSTSVVNLLLSLIPGTITGNIAYSNNGTGIQGATVNLANASGGIIATTTTDSSGNYSFTNVISGSYNVTASKPMFFGNSSGIFAVTPGSTNTVNLILWMKGDLNNNGMQADAGDLVLMKRAAIGEITPGVGTATPAFTYDLNNNGMLADAGDLVLMKRAAIGEIILL